MIDTDFVKLKMLLDFVNSDYKLESTVKRIVRPILPSLETSTRKTALDEYKEVKSVYSDSRKLKISRNIRRSGLMGSGSSLVTFFKPDCILELQFNNSSYCLTKRDVYWCI